VRVPVKVFGDLRAQLAACHISERSLIELAEHYGVDKVGHYMTELIDYSERMTRAAIRELPDGSTVFSTTSTMTGSMSESRSRSR
jgi:N-methylhydantoinase B